MTTWLDLISDALFELGVYSPGEPIAQPVMDICQRWLNRIIDRWAALDRFAFAQQFNVYQIIPNHQPHTLGPGAAITATSLTGNIATYTAANNFAQNDPVTVAATTNGAGIFNVTGGVILAANSTSFTVAITHADIGAQAENGRASNIPAVGDNPAPVVPDWLTTTQQPRPARLAGVDLVLNTSNPSTDLLINVRDADWWRRNQVKDVTSTVPTDVYHQADYPNAALYFWPVPTFGYQARVQTNQQIIKVEDLTIPFTAPPTYEEALLIELACAVAAPMSKSISPELAAHRKIALAALETENISSPRIASADYGAGLGRGNRGFNWISGTPAGYSGGR